MYSVVWLALFIACIQIGTALEHESPAGSLFKFKKVQEDLPFHNAENTEEGDNGGSELAKIVGTWKGINLYSNGRHQEQWVLTFRSNHHAIIGRLPQSQADFSGTFTTAPGTHGMEMDIKITNGAAKGMISLCLYAVDWTGTELTIAIGAPGDDMRPEDYGKDVVSRNGVVITATTDDFVTLPKSATTTAGAQQNGPNWDGDNRQSTGVLGYSTVHRKPESTKNIDYTRPVRTTKTIAPKFSSSTDLNGDVDRTQVVNPGKSGSEQGETGLKIPTEDGDLPPEESGPSLGFTLHITRKMIEMILGLGCAACILVFVGTISIVHACKRNDDDFDDFERFSNNNRYSEAQKAEWNREFMV